MNLYKVQIYPSDLATIEKDIKQYIVDYIYYSWVYVVQ